MLIRLRKASDPRPSEITPQGDYINRRKFIAAAAFGLGPFSSALVSKADAAQKDFQYGANLKTYVIDGYEKLGANDSVTFPTAFFSYNNYNEFGSDKRDPAALSGGVSSWMGLTTA